ncbi:hypothetical protein DL93DRAFT_1857903 [Clavulina sp. PMI_390]|nr:hypothetical protein DL93DRAFT_1857903 [Clavulina sp. PMI_390]
MEEPRRRRADSGDPFGDSLGGTTSPRNETNPFYRESPRRQGSVRRPPPSAHINMSMAEALQDIVTVKPVRSKPARATTSSTGVSITSPPLSSSVSSRPRAHHRAMTADSMDSGRQSLSESESRRTPRKKTTTAPTNTNAKTNTTGSNATTTTASSAHARHRIDVIDQLDPSGLSLGTFHHDGPFDALAPSRNNRGNVKSPMRAFNDSAHEATTDSALTRDALRHARKNSNSPYDVAAVYTGTNLVGNNPNYIPGDGLPKSPPKSALAEAWGRADPEPFEEFSAGVGFVNGNGTTNGGANGAPTSPIQSYPYPQYGDMENAMTGGVGANPADQSTSNRFPSFLVVALAILSFRAPERHRCYCGGGGGSWPIDRHDCVARVPQQSPRHYHQPWLLCGVRPAILALHLLSTFTLMSGCLLVVFLFFYVSNFLLYDLRRAYHF